MGVGEGRYDRESKILCSRCDCGVGGSLWSGGGHRGGRRSRSRRTRDLAGDLRRQLCRCRRAGLGALSRQPLGRQLGHPLQLAGRRQQQGVGLVLHEHPGGERGPGPAARRLHRRHFRGREPGRRCGASDHSTPDRLDSDRCARKEVGLFGGEVRHPGSDGVHRDRWRVLVSVRCRERFLGRRQAHRQRPDRHLDGDRRNVGHRLGGPPRARRAVVRSRQRAHAVVGDPLRRPPCPAHV